MTDVEPPSTVPSSRSARWPRRAAVVGGAVVTALSSVLLTPWHPAVADPLGSAQAEASRIAAQLAADQQHLDVVSQQYDAAQERVQNLAQQVAQIRTTVSQDQAQVGQDQGVLRQEAVNSYMAGTTDTSLQSLFGSGAEQATAAAEYQSVASGTLEGAVDALDVAQTHLADQEAHLQSAQTQAQAALTQETDARQSAQATVSDQESLLSQMKGRVATLVAQKQAAEAAAAHALFEARLAAAAATAASTTGSPHHGDGSGNTGTGSGGGGSGPSLPNLPAAGGAARALQAAESQIGVPYVWGGESPGHGFDCSGLAQWSWAQAGVSLPRTAAAQYDAIPHIPLSDLQPGDLVFWGYGGVSHVGIYAGGGDVVDAPQTGQDVQVQPIWGNGLVGAGRP